MKKTKTLWLGCVAMTLLLSFGSCDDDSSYYATPIWYYEDIPAGYGYTNWQEYTWWNHGYEQPDDSRLQMAEMLAHNWKGQLEAVYTENGVEHRDSFDFQIQFQRASKLAAVGLGTEFTWKYINGVTSQNNKASRNFVWYIDENYDIYLQYSTNGTPIAKIANNDLKLGYDDRGKMIFDGTLRGVNYEETDDFFTDLIPSRASNSYKNIRQIRLSLESK